MSKRFPMKQVRIKLIILFCILIPAAMSVASCSEQGRAEEEATLPPGNTNVATQQLTDGLEHPWGMAFLPDGSLLITERPGKLRVLSTDNQLSEPISGLPSVFAAGQGGMLDVAIDPDFENNKLVYLSFSEPGPDNTAGTALGRGVLTEEGLSDFEVIFRQVPKASGGIHFGSRIAFKDGHLYLTLGERNQRDQLQNLGVHLGTIVRINPDGSVPADNPFVNEPGALPEIWTYGHRNVQGSAFDPSTGNFWTHEFGPLHGDELNLVVAGSNYGWPEVSWGDEYNGDPIPDHDTRPEFTDAVIWWNPTIAPSGMDFYTGDMFPQWQNHLLIGGLQSLGLVMVKVNGDTAEESSRLDLGARIRDVKQAPDGSVYVITDEGNGKVIRIYAN